MMRCTSRRRTRQRFTVDSSELAKMPLFTKRATQNQCERHWRPYRGANRTMSAVKAALPSSTFSCRLCIALREISHRHDWLYRGQQFFKSLA